jgi:hypothetical protein
MERIISYKEECEEWCWFRVTHDRNQWRAIVCAVMNLRVAEHLVVSQERRCSTEFVPGSCAKYTGAKKEDEHRKSVPELPVV